MNAKQQREWEDDVTQPCAFPEPLAEVLTRENRELRAEVERLTEQSEHWRRSYIRQLRHTIQRERERDAAEERLRASKRC